MIPVRISLKDVDSRQERRPLFSSANASRRATSEIAKLRMRDRGINPRGYHSVSITAGRVT